MDTGHFGHLQSETQSHFLAWTVNRIQFCGNFTSAQFFVCDSRSQRHLKPAADSGRVPGSRHDIQTLQYLQGTA